MISIMSTLEKHFDLEYNNAASLDYEYYENKKYNSVRRCKLILFSHCLGSNDQFKKNSILTEDYKKNNEMLKQLGLCKNIINTINKYAYPVNLTKEYITKHLERGCLNRSIEKAKSYNIRCIWTESKFIDLYHSICYKVACNIDPTSSINSNYALKKILTNEIPIADVANMTSKELCPKKYEQIEDRVNKRTNLERNIKYSELYRCRKCKTNKTTTERRYARSWDEGTDLTIHCINCGFSWNN